MAGYKEVIGKTKILNSNLPRSLIINKEEIYSRKKIAEHFNSFFCEDWA